MITDRRCDIEDCTAAPEDIHEGEHHSLCTEHDLCPDCEGEGEHIRDEWTSDVGAGRWGGHSTRHEPCSTCGGTGRRTEIRDDAAYDDEDPPTDDEYA